MRNCQDEPRAVNVEPTVQTIGNLINEIRVSLVEAIGATCNIKAKLYSPEPQGGSSVPAKEPDSIEEMLTVILKDISVLTRELMHIDKKLWKGDGKMPRRNRNTRAIPRARDLKNKFEPKQIKQKKKTVYNIYPGRLVAWAEWKDGKICSNSM